MGAMPEIEKSVEKVNCDEKERNSEPQKGVQKKYRKRKRQHYNTIRQLMEFYFGDANLSKDRFLMQKIKEDPFVPLELFLTFNKMKSLTNSVEEIKFALTNSEILELDEEKKKVRRKTEIRLDRDVDHKILYIESLPPTADHDWLTEKFSCFGKVVYISLPKYSKSKKIKEFAFIEFEEESAVQSAVKTFQEFNGVLNIQATDPAKLQSIQSFIIEQKNEEIKSIEKCEDDVSNKRKKPQNIDNSNSICTDEPEEKRAKIDSSDILNTDQQQICKKDKTNDDDDTVDTADSCETEQQQQQSDEKIKKKQRKRKNKSKKNAKKRINEEAEFFEMKILPKKEWKRLRSKYLNLQRQKLSELKRLAWKQRQEQQQQQQQENTTNTNDSMKKKIVNRKFEKMNMNFYGAGSENELAINDNHKETNIVKDEKDKKNLALERTPLFSYEPGLIIEIDFLEPCINVKEFKIEMRQYEHVKYVDVKEGAIQAYLRLESPETAQEFVKKITCAEYNCKILIGEQETEYWNKIKLDREAKLNKQIRMPVRGREKVKKIVAKHIHFGDDEEDLILS